MILGLHHVGIAVEDLEQAVRLYEKSFGGRCTARGRSQSEAMQYALVQAGDAELELMESSDPESPVGRFLARRGPGVHHLAYRVDDVRAELQTLEAQGFELAGEVRQGVHGTPVAFLHPKSVGGVLTELVQAPKQ